MQGEREVGGREEGGRKGTEGGREGGRWRREEGGRGDEGMDTNQQVSCCLWLHSKEGGLITLKVVPEATTLQGALVRLQPAPTLQVQSRAPPHTSAHTPPIHTNMTAPLYCYNHPQETSAAMNTTTTKLSIASEAAETQRPYRRQTTAPSTLD